MKSHKNYEHNINIYKRFRAHSLPIVIRQRMSLYICVRPTGLEISHHVFLATVSRPPSSGIHSTSYPISNKGSFPPRKGGRSVKLTIPHHLVLRLRLREA